MVKSVYIGEGLKKEYGGVKVEDKMIVDLFWERSEDAILKTREKYEKYCYKIVYNILQSKSDAEECVNDTYLNLWNSIPPNRPQSFSAFLGKIARNVALNRYYHNSAMKRNADIDVILDEVTDFVPSDGQRDKVAEDTVLKDLINRFLASLPKQNRIIFVKRYWYLNSISEIADAAGLSSSNVKIKLMRTRKKFKTFLEKEGVSL